MPELPEVQTVVNDLKAAGLAGTTIKRVRVFWPRIVSELPVRTFCGRLRNQSVGDVRRRGKYIVIDLSGGASLLIHLRMTGRLHFLPADAPRSKHEHLVIELNDARQLRFHDTRKFGRVQLADEAEDVLGRLGPEPLQPRCRAGLGASQGGTKRGGQAVAQQEHGVGLRHTRANV